MPKKSVKKKKKSSVKQELKKEEVCETFEVGKKGEEKIIKTCGIKPEKHATKEEIEKQNKTLRNVLIVVGAIILVTIATYFIFNSLKYFEYEEKTWDVLHEGAGITFYHTSFPMYKNGKQFGVYNVYIRNNPKTLGKDVNFEGEGIHLREMFVLNYTDDINCNGKGVIAVANMKQVFGAMGSTIIQDPNATCDSQNRYMHANIISSNENKIDVLDKTCFNLYFKDCEILEVTERFILEGLKLI